MADEAKPDPKAASASTPKRRLSPEEKSALSAATKAAAAALASKCEKKYGAELARARACKGTYLADNVIANLLADRYTGKPCILDGRPSDIEADLADLEARAAFNRQHEAAVAARDAAKKEIAP